jgi:hypothetical protein
MVMGSVRKTKIGFTKLFIIAKSIATPIAVKKLLICTPLRI